MAALALKRIRQTPESSQLDVRIFVDNTTDHVLDEFEYVRDEYFPEAMIYHARPHIYAPSGCWNILNALKAGYETGAEIIFMIEEDVLISKNYFKYSFKAHEENPNCFAVCGRFRPEYREKFYTNPGSSFRRYRLGFVAENITDTFFNDRLGYLDARFNEFPEASPLDDGLIRRVIRQHNSYVVYPETAEVAHIGFHYYNKLGRYTNEGTIQEKIGWLRNFLSSVPARRKEDPRYIKDLEDLGGDSPSL